MSGRPALGVVAEPQTEVGPDEFHVLSAPEQTRTVLSLQDTLALYGSEKPQEALKAEFPVTAVLLEGELTEAPDKLPPKEHPLSAYLCQTRSKEIDRWYTSVLSATQFKSGSSKAHAELSHGQDIDTCILYNPTFSKLSEHFNDCIRTAEDECAVNVMLMLTNAAKVGSDGWDAIGPHLDHIPEQQREELLEKARSIWRKRTDDHHKAIAELLEVVPEICPSFHLGLTEHHKKAIIAVLSSGFNVGQFAQLEFGPKSLEGFFELDPLAQRLGIAHGICAIAGAHGHAAGKGSVVMQEPTAANILSALQGLQLGTAARAYDYLMDCRALDLGRGTAQIEDRICIRVSTMAVITEQAKLDDLVDIIYDPNLDPQVRRALEDHLGLPEDSEKTEVNLYYHPNILKNAIQKNVSKGLSYRDSLLKALTVSADSFRTFEEQVQGLDPERRSVTIFGRDLAREAGNADFEVHSVTVKPVGDNFRFEPQVSPPVTKVIPVSDTKPLRRVIVEEQRQARVIKHPVQKLIWRSLAYANDHISHYLMRKTNLLRCGVLKAPTGDREADILALRGELTKFRERNAALIHLGGTQIAHAIFNVPSEVRYDFARNNLERPKFTTEDSFASHVHGARWHITRLQHLADYLEHDPVTEVDSNAFLEQLSDHFEYFQCLEREQNELEALVSQHPNLAVPTLVRSPSPELLSEMIGVFEQHRYRGKSPLTQRFGTVMRLPEDWQSLFEHGFMIALTQPDRRLLGACAVSNHIDVALTMPKVIEQFGHLGSVGVLHHIGRNHEANPMLPVWNILMDSIALQLADADAVVGGVNEDNQLALSSDLRTGFSFYPAELSYVSSDLAPDPKSLFPGDTDMRKYGIVLSLSEKARRLMAARSVDPRKFVPEARTLAKQVAMRQFPGLTGEFTIREAWQLLTTQERYLSLQQGLQDLFEDSTNDLVQLEGLSIEGMALEAVCCSIAETWNRAAVVQFFDDLSSDKSFSLSELKRVLGRSLIRGVALAEQVKELNALRAGFESKLEADFGPERAENVLQLLRKEMQL